MRTRLKNLGWSAIHRGVESLPVPLASQVLTRLMPRWLVVEPTNHCNHACTLCPQPQHPRPRGHMALADFRGLVDEVRGFANHMCLTELGESLLNPALFDMVRYAEGAGIPCAINTNGHLLDQHIDQVLDSGLSMIKIAVDGIDRQTHERYRVGSDFERLTAGVAALCAERTRRGATRPHITVLNLVFRFNQDQREEMKRWGAAVGVDRVGFKPVRLLSAQFNGASFEQLAEEYLPSDPELLHPAYRGAPLARDRRVCPNFYEATVLWNGDLVACSCCAFDGSHAVGNVFRDGGLRAVWSSARRRRTLAAIMRRQTGHCATCDTPLQGCWLRV